MHAREEAFPDGLEHPRRQEGIGGRGYHRGTRLALWMLFAINGGVVVLSGADGTVNLLD